MADPISSTVVGIIGKFADKFLPDKKDADAFKLAVQKEADAGAMAELDRSYDAIIAEAQSTDKWTSRARPSFMYVIYILFLSSIPFGIWYAAHPVSANNFSIGMAAFFKAIPDILYQTFGVGYVGYSVSRSYDKMNEVKHGKK